MSREVRPQPLACWPDLKNNALASGYPNNACYPGYWLMFQMLCGRSRFPGIYEGYEKFAADNADEIECAD